MTRTKLNMIKQIQIGEQQWQHPQVQLLQLRGIKTHANQTNVKIEQHMYKCRFWLYLSLSRWIPRTIL